LEFYGFSLCAFQRCLFSTLSAVKTTNRREKYKSFSQSTTKKKLINYISNSFRQLLTDVRINTKTSSLT
ncbi:MAG: hypothetical protein ACR2KZ_05410, partial [Segetibacter sp.]